VRRRDVKAIEESATLDLARRVLAKGAKLSQHEASLVHAAAARATRGTLTAEMGERLKGIAARVGVAVWI
jgi:hypothetical protein